ncbi:Nucleoside-diphosphate-sugar epimerase [Catalinimonas alkaloidigena]|uniref:Nucleoside-diphosphate-sugar epimerase n=1 Tax=Catalinimonas alkaloidigena TaxID=1075417 RepID=A0A1G9E298_9BACT|nr:NAD-dependent epimerase/dehydratase family protein [Catalinimonas alkaloidigena]SDK70200.1 Nucleoside-diphosphate-sugar epimerase [Catalinimonas alkaloidigena]
MVLVTGANGLVGAYLVKALLLAGHPVRALIRSETSDLQLLRDVLPELEIVYGDLLDVPVLRQHVQGCRYVIHAAAMVTFEEGVEDDMLRTNVEGTANVVNACLANAVVRLCHISSVAALGRRRPGEVIDEHAQWVESPYNSFYARTKYLAELEVYRGIAEGLHAFSVNPSLVLGPGPWERSSMKIFRYVWNKGWFYTQGKANYVDVRDVAQIVTQLLEDDVSAGERFIVSAGAVEYHHLFARIAQAFDRRQPPFRAGRFLAEVAWRWELARKLLTGRRPTVTRDVARNANRDFRYTNEKVKALLNYEFRPFDDTIEWTCRVLRENFGEGKL